jgi:hypothetical protein
MSLPGTQGLNDRNKAVSENDEETRAAATFRQSRVPGSHINRNIDRQRFLLQYTFRLISSDRYVAPIHGERRG